MMEESTKIDEVISIARRFWWVALLVVVALVAWIVTSSNAADEQARKNEEEIQRIIEEEQKGTQGNSPIPEGFDVDGTDELLIQQQPSLTQRYGKAPDNFIWDTDGSLLSLGDRTLAPEDVLYTYLRSLSTLDFDVVHMFSKRSTVYNTYSGYFEQTSARTDAREKYNRDIYRLMLSTMQIGEVKSSSRFSDNRRVYTVSAKILDLTDKSFWKKDRDSLMDTLYTFGKTEEDQNKADEYLYNYVLGYYSGSDSSYRDVSFDITLTKSVPLNSGWLVSIDNDLNNLLQNRDGVQVVQSIKSEFKQYSTERQIGK